MGNSTSHVGSENTSSEGTRWKSGKTFVVDPVYAATAAGADDATSSPPLVDSSGKSYNDGGFGENHTWMTHSYRSVQSSTGKSTSSSQVVAASLHTNLMRSHRQKDPMKYYTVVAILGKGSMGSVAKVKKKDSAKGGSARPEYVKENHGPCYQFCNQNNFVTTMIYNIVQRFKSKNNRDALTIPKVSHHYNEYKDNSHDDEVSVMNYKIENTKRAAATTGTPPNSVNSSLTTTTTSVIPKNKRLLKHASSSVLVTHGTRKEQYYALKSIHLERCQSKDFIEELKNEVDILKRLDHPNIVRAIETFDYKGRLFLLLELCQGGDLYSRDPYTEKDAKHIVNCLLSAVSYMHSKGIVHRDLKFENICFADTSNISEVRIIDFGLSQKFAANEHLHDAVGTVYTMAPELLKGEYDAKVDIWSIGVIAFSLLSSSLPFFGHDRLSVMKKILRGKYRFTSRRWTTVSFEAKKFVSSILQQDPTIRPSAIDAMDAAWLKDDNSKYKPFTSEEIEQMDAIQSSIQAFSTYPTLKKLALMVVAYQSTSEEVGYIRRLFDRFDLTKDGEVGFDQFKNALADHYEYSDNELEQMFHGIDIDGTGKVHYIEFLAATIEALGAIDEERLAEAFNRIDADESGFITVSDLKNFLGEDIPNAYIDRVIDEADIYHDHRVSYDEFLALWNAEADEVMSQSKSDVLLRRKISRTGSTISANSSIGSSTDEVVVPINDDDPTKHPQEKTEKGNGDFYFSQRKMQSIRKIEIDMKDIVDFGAHHATVEQ